MDAAFEGTAHHQEGRVDGLPVSPWKGCRSYHGHVKNRGVIVGNWRGDEVCGPESEGCRHVDVVLGRGAQDTSGKNTLRSQACQGTSLQEGAAGHVVFFFFFSNGLLRKAMRRRMRWLKMKPLLDGREMAQIRANTVQREEKRLTRPGSTLPAFTVRYRSARTVKNSSRSRKKGGPCDQKHGS